KARKMRKLLGGGMRQAGVLAACGIISLEKMVDRLEEDHKNAKYLARKLNEIEGLSIDMDKDQINMVFRKVDKEDFNSHEFTKTLLEKGIKINDDGNIIRFVTNKDVNKKDIDYVIDCIKEIVQL